MPPKQLLDSEARSRTSWKRLALFAVLISLAIVPLFFIGSAQAEGDAETATTAVVNQGADAAFPSALVADPIKRTEKDPPKGTLKKIDGFFDEIVGHLGDIFFLKLFPHQEQSITLLDRGYYVREPGSGSSFAEIDYRGEMTGEELTIQQAEAFEARGMLEVITGEKEVDSTGSEEQRTWRGGELNGKPVEYVTVINNEPKKYVRVQEADGTVLFRKQLSRRELLSDNSEDALSPSDVAKLAAQGRLQVDGGKLDSDGNLLAGVTNPYLIEKQAGGVPLIVLWLAAGSVFFTIYMGFFNLWGFRHALSIVGGRYDNPNEPGEVTHFQALSSALSATVGLGNIAGVTIAMTLGGPGAFFWMLACGFFGMTSKFVECTLGQKYRTVKPDGTILGGPMQYLSAGLKELGLGKIGAVLGVLFAILCIIASFGGGNMFQANQAGATLLAVVQDAEQDQLIDINKNIKAAAEAEDFAKLEALETERETLSGEMSQFEDWFLGVFGVVLATLVGLVIVGGIKRIGAAAEKIVPTMCGMYILACLYVIGMHIAEVPTLFASIFAEAFTGEAFGGGMIGVLVIGVRRAAFSNEAGVGSAAIAHSAAKTDEPVREGAVALLGPFIDTIVICSMTALVILITGAWDNDAWLDQGLEAAPLASRAFAEEIAWFPYTSAVLAIAILLFAYSTIVSWSYYGERCWERLFGPRTTIVYKILFIGGVFVGANANLGAVIDFSDYMILAMAFPNVLGAAILAPGVKRDLADYWRRYKAGEFQTFK